MLTDINHTDADAQFGTAYEYFEKLHSQSKSTAKARKNEGNNNDVNENSKLVLGLEDNMDSTTVAGVVEKGKGYYGARACRAIGALAAMGQIETTINNFLVPLQVYNNINTTSSTSFCALSTIVVSTY